MPIKDFLPIKILEKLTKIIDIKEILNDFSGKIISFDFSKKYEDHSIHDNRTLLINPEKLTEKQLYQIKKELIDPEIKAGRAILEKGVPEDTKNILKNLPKGEDKKLIDFYSDKLNSEFMEALEAALIIRSLSHKGEDISKKKSDINKKYPLFGRNLCNMVSARYFDKDFKELYINMKEAGGFDPRDYEETVIKTVKHKPYTEFIHNHKNLDEWLDLLQYKIDRLKKYGLHEFEIYAFSYEHVKLAEEILEEYCKDKDIKVEIITKTKTYIFAKLLF